MACPRCRRVLYCAITKVTVVQEVTVRLCSPICRRLEAVVARAHGRRSLAPRRRPVSARSRSSRRRLVSCIDAKCVNVNSLRICNCKCICKRRVITNSTCSKQVRFYETVPAGPWGRLIVCLLGSQMERTGDSSETDSWVSSPSIYYCMVCNIAVNSPAQLEAHTASHKHKLRIPMSAANGPQRTHSRSSSTSSETPGRQTQVRP